MKSRPTRSVRRRNQHVYMDRAGRGRQSTPAGENACVIFSLRVFSAHIPGPFDKSKNGWRAITKRGHLRHHQQVKLRSRQSRHLRSARPGCIYRQLAPRYPHTSASLLKPCPFVPSTGRRYSRMSAGRPLPPTCGSCPCGLLPGNREFVKTSPARFQITSRPLPKEIQRHQDWRLRCSPDCRAIQWGPSAWLTHTIWTA